MFIGVLLFGLYNIPTPPKSEQVKLEYGIFECDAPFGKYWIDESGTYLLASGHSDSQLTESYTVKYMIGNELRTIILDATDDKVHVILTGENETSMIFQEYKWAHVKSDGTILWDLDYMDSDYYIYIPNPNTIDDQGVEN